MTPRPAHTIILALVFSACSGFRSAEDARPAAAHAGNGAASASARTAAIIAVNDVYRVAGVDEGSQGGLARIRTLRRAWEATYPDHLFLHAGDFLYPSLMSKELDGVQMIDILNWMDGDGEAFDDRMFVTFGNHEFENNDLEDADELSSHIDNSRFTWINSNIEFVVDQDGFPVVNSPNLSASSIVTSGGIRFGIFSMTGSFESAGYIREYRLGPSVASNLARELRDRGAEVVVALTHLSNEDDVAILAQSGRDGPDLIVGGHEHSAVRYRDPDSGRWMIKADADARTASVILVSIDAAGTVGVSPMSVQVNTDTVSPDPVVTTRVNYWEYKNDVAFCGDEQLGCLDEVIGRTLTDLHAEEVKIRSAETSVGNFAADQMLAAYPEADVAVINSGSLRLNQDLAAGTTIRRRHIEELFAWPAPIRVIRISGSTLMQALMHSVANRGEGAWLQVAGLRYRYSCANGSCRITSAERANRDASSGSAAWMPVNTNDTLDVVVGDFMVCHPGRDGYLMWNARDLVDTDSVAPCAPEISGDKPDLKVLVIEALRAATSGVAPVVENRIVAEGD